MIHRRSTTLVPRSLSVRAVTLAVSLVVGAADVVDAQSSVQDTTFSYLTEQPVPVIINLDSVGIYAPSAPPPEAIGNLIRALGVRTVRAMGDGLFVAGLEAPHSRQELVTLAREAVALSSGVIRVAGLVVRPLGATDPLFVTDQFIVEFLPDVTLDQVEALNAVFEVEVVARMGLLDNDYVLTVTPASITDALDLANLYHEDSLTVFAHPNFIDRGQARAILPNDPLFPSQWHLHNTGQLGGTPDADIDAPEAWGITPTGSPNIVIAIVEIDGFDTLNNDVAANLWDNPGENPTDGADNTDLWVKADDVHGWNFQSCTGDPSTANMDPCGSESFVDMDDMRHGTAVAGLAAGRGDNAEGISGVCPECELMLIKKGSGDAATASALRYAWEMGADVINLSWGGYPKPYTKAQIEKAVAAGRGGKGTVVVTSMWNENRDECVDDISGIPVILSVGGSDNFDERASRSGFGNCIDLLAPGWMANNVSPQIPQNSGNPPLLHISGIVTADRKGQAGYNSDDKELSGCRWITQSTNLESTNQDYTKCFSGNSAASAIVAGVVGLMLRVNPNLDADQIIDILHRTADKIEYSGGCTAAQNVANYSPCPVVELSWSDTHGYGRVNAFRAVQEAEALVEPTTPTYEIGTRLGLTVMDGAIDRTVFNFPGSGPLSLPVLYGAWFLNSSWELELQLGGALRTGGSAPDERELVAALQPAFHFSLGSSGSWFFAPSVAGHWMGVSNLPNTSNFGIGVAFGRRLTPRPFLAVRLEARYRRWFSNEIDELGLAIGFGVVLN